MGELLGPLVFGWTLFIVLFVFSIDLFKLAQLAARGANLADVAEMLGLRVVLASVYCLPMAMLLAGLMAFGRLSGDSELIATQSGGISNLRIVRNASILGLLLSFAGLAINEYVIPPAGQRLRVLEARVKAQLTGRIVEDLTNRQAVVIQDTSKQGKLERVVVASKFEPEEPPRPAIMRNVTYIEYDRGEWKSIVQAKRAEWMGKTKWMFYDADTQFRHAQNNENRVFQHHQTLELTINKTPQDVARTREQKRADQMSYRELQAYIAEQKMARTARLRDIRELEVELERKLAVPFAALVLALVGAPLGIRRQRSTAGVGIGLSLLIIIIYYMGMSFLGVLGENGQIAPRQAAWGCNVGGLLVGLYLTWRSSR
jgi:lipopolysaccharide export system permease protein